MEGSLAELFVVLSLKDNLSGGINESTNKLTGFATSAAGVAVGACAVALCFGGGYGPCAPGRAAAGALGADPAAHGSPPAPLLCGRTPQRRRTPRAACRPPHPQARSFSPRLHPSVPVLPDGVIPYLHPASW